MLKILNTNQIKEWDAYTIKNEPIASNDLMERACTVFVQWFTERYDATKKVGIICGTGNNGGDGLGIARLLADWGYQINVWIVKGAVLESVDFKINRQRLPDKVEVHEISGKPEANIFSTCDIIIDGIFGSGLSRDVEGIYAEVIAEINSAKAKVIAIDIPSGLFADKHTPGLSVEADFTITFQQPKLAFFLAENEKRVGKWLAVDIKLSKDYLKEVEAPYYLMEKKWVSKKLPVRNIFSHKGDFGKVLLIAGSLGKMGACILGARAVMRSGAGLLTVHVPQCGYEIIQTAVPEAMASVDKDEHFFSNPPDTEIFTAIGVGPGLDKDKRTIKALEVLFEKENRPMVIDADALNILSANQAMLHLVPANSILTPHPGELRRLVGEWKNDFERIDLTKSLSKKTNTIIIVKGAYTMIVTPDGRVFFNSSGNPGMATAGSGDVLTGIITALLGQKLDPLDAALCGVFIHGFAGDLAVYDKGPVSLMASDIINALPGAFKQLSH